MSAWATTPKVAYALGVLGVNKAEREWWDNNYARWDRAAVLEMLEVLCCPLVCDGPTRSGGEPNPWHEVCVKKAKTALAEMDPLNFDPLVAGGDDQ